LVVVFELSVFFFFFFYLVFCLQPAEKCQRNASRNLTWRRRRRRRRGF